MQYAPIIAQDMMSAVDERDDCMAALHELAAKFAADQPRGSRYENTATGRSRHDSFLVLGTSGPNLCLLLGAAIREKTSPTWDALNNQTKTLN
jgi:hypothetical protein